MAAEELGEVPQAPTMFEQAYWDADDEAIGQAYDALLVAPDTVSGERLTKFVELTWHVAVQNRLRQRELALKVGELMAAQESLAQPKPRRSARVPKAAMAESESRAV